MSDHPHSLVFDRVAHEYDATRGGEERGRSVADFLRPQLGHRTPVLEIGVGTGVVSLALRDDGVDVVGFDLSDQMLRRARQRIPGRIVQADAEQLPFSDETFGAACAVWVLHLVRDVRAVLAEARRVLRPGGRLVAAVQSFGYEPDDTLAHEFVTLNATLRGPRRDAPERLQALGAEVDLGVVDVVIREGMPYEESPAEMIRRIETRTYSMLWELSDENWQEHVVPVLERLRAMSDLDVPRRRVPREVYVVLERS